MLSSHVSAFPRYLNTNHDVEMLPSQLWYCRFLAFAVLSSIQCSTYLIIAMTFERFYSIIRPHKAASFNTVKKAKIIIGITFVFSYSFNIPYLFIAENDDKICIQNSIASKNALGVFYYWLTEIVSFILPFLSLLTFNSIIIHTLRQRSKLSLLESQSQGQGQGQLPKGQKQSDGQIFTMLLLVTFGYLILITPGKVLIFYLSFYTGSSTYYYAGLHLFYQIGEKTLYTNHGINFLFYVLSGQKFRTDLKNLFIQKKKPRIEQFTSVVSVINN